MKVMFVSTWATDCGIASYTAQLREALAAHDLTSDVAIIDRAATAYMTREELVRHFEQLGASAAHADIAHLQHEFGLLRGAYGYRTSIETLRAFLRGARGAGAVVVTYHSEPFHFERRDSGLAAFAADEVRKAHWRLRGAPPAGRRAMAIAHTRTSRRALVDSGLPTEKVVVIPHGVAAPAPPDTAEERRRAKAEIGLPDDSVVLALFGFVTRYKGHLTAIRALKRLDDRHHLLVLGGIHPRGGDRGLDRMLRELRRDDGLRRRVLLTGHVPSGELDRRLQAADIVLAPYGEHPVLSASGAATWGLRSGRPLLASRIPFFVELQETWGCCELMTPSAPDELAYRIDALGRDQSRIDELVANARRFAEACSWEAVAAQHTALYRNLLAG